MVINNFWKRAASEKINCLVETESSCPERVSQTVMLEDGVRAPCVDVVGLCSPERNVHNILKANSPRAD